MRVVTLFLLLGGYGWADPEDSPPPASLSVYRELTAPGRVVLYADPGATFFRPPSASSLQRPRSVALDRQFLLGGQVPLQTHFLFLPLEERREEDPLQRFQQRIERQYGPQGALAEEDPWARSALQIGLEQKGQEGNFAASFTQVGMAFDQDQPYGLERGSQQTALAGQYLLRPGLSLATEFTHRDREALAQRPASDEEVWRNQLQFRPSEASQWQVIHERTRAQEGSAATRTKESVKVTGEQQLGKHAKLTLQQRQEHQQEAAGERWKRETSGRLEGHPSRRVDVNMERKLQQNGPGAPRTTDEWEVRYRPEAPLSVRSRYLQEEQGDRWKQKREVELEGRPGEDLKVTTGFQQARKPGERYDTHSLELEATPGRHAKLKTGFQEEEKARGNLERTQTAELEWQPTARLNVSGRYREKDERRGPERVSQALSWTHRATEWLTVTGAEEAEWQEGRQMEAGQRLGLEGQLSGGLSIALSQERREKEAQEWEVQSVQAAYRPSEAWQLSGRYSQRTTASAQAVRSQQAQLEARPWPGLHLLGRLAENPEDAQGRVTLGRQLQAQMEYQLTSGLSLSGRAARQEDERQRLQRQETELGLSLGSEASRLSSHLRLEQTLSLGRQFLTEYRLGYSRRIGSRLSWSVEGLLQRWENRYGPVGSQQEEYRGEAKLNLNF